MIYGAVAQAGGYGNPPLHMVLVLCGLAVVGVGLRADPFYVLCDNPIILCELLSP